MYPFIKKIILLLFLPLLLFAGIYEALYRHIPNSYTLKEREMRSRQDHIEVLVFGSSHTYYGINPEWIIPSTFNAANISQDYCEDHFLFFRYATKMAHLRCVVFSLSYFSPWEFLSEEEDCWRERKYSIYMGKEWRRSLNPKYHFEFMSLGNRSLLQSFIGKDLQGCNSNGFGTDYSQGNLFNETEEKGRETVLRHSHLLRMDSIEQVRHLTTNRAYLDEICSYCRERDIAVLFLTLPAWHTYYNALLPRQYSAMKEFGESLQQHEGVDYLNWLKDPRFTEEDFYDNNHLNAKGAKKLSLLLNDYLMRKLAKQKEKTE